MSERFLGEHDGESFAEKHISEKPSFENNLGSILENIKPEDTPYSPRDFNNVLGSMLYAVCDNKNDDSGKDDRGKDEKSAQREDANDSVGEKSDANESKRPNWKESEDKAKEIYGGEEQPSYKDGKKVPHGTPGSTRPDLVVENPETGQLTAIEVKNYDLSDEENVKALCDTLKKQVEDRNSNMPEGTEQRIVLDVRGQGLSDEKIDEVAKEIQDSLGDVYADIPVDIIKDEVN